MLKNALLFYAFASTALAQCPPDINRADKPRLRACINELRQQVSGLNANLLNAQNQFTALSSTMNHIRSNAFNSSIDVSNDTRGIVPGIGGWIEDSNATLYSKTYASQLGSIWILRNGKYQQLATIFVDSLGNGLDIDLNEEVLSRYSINNSTQVNGSGGAPVVSIIAGLSNDQAAKIKVIYFGHAEFNTTLDGLEHAAKQLYRIYGSQIFNDKLYITTAMHVIKFEADIFRKTDLSVDVSSPIVKLGGNYYFQEDFGQKRYKIFRRLVPVQLTQSIRQQMSRDQELNDIRRRLAENNLPRIGITEFYDFLQARSGQILADLSIRSFADFQSKLIEALRMNVNQFAGYSLSRVNTEGLIPPASIVSSQIDVSLVQTVNSGARIIQEQKLTGVKAGSE